MGGNLFHYYELARYLHPDQAVIGLHARGGFGTSMPDRSIETIATQCIESLRAVQPSGPYRVAGFSSGGVVAYEIAQQLSGHGERVALLALLDSYAPRPMTVSRLAVELRRALRDRANVRMVQEIAYFLVLHRLKLGWLRALRSIGEAHRWAHWSYRPKPYRHPVELYLARASTERARADGLGWSRCVSELRIAAEFPGKHGDLVKPPIVAELAAMLQARLDCLDGE
jgi:thioesterase domain-containing protein